MVENKNTYERKIKDDWTRKPIDHTRFGGYIYESDFDTEAKPYDSYDGSRFAARLISNWNFDYFCQMNGESRRRLKEIVMNLDNSIRKGDAIF